MGWWSIERGDQSLLQGDEPYDTIGAALEQVSREYEEEWRRKPTLAELLLTIETVLAAGSHLYTLEGEEVEITSLVARTRKRRKFQRYRVGDFFAIPLPGGLRAYGRILSDARYGDLGMLVGIYDRVSERLLRPQELRGGAFMFEPFFCSSEAWETWRWRIIGNLPVDPGEFSFPRNKVLDARRGWVVREGDRVYPATEEEVRTLHYAALWPFTGVEYEITERLRTKGLLRAE